MDRERLKMFVIGGLTGAIAGLLFAPKSGRELRGTLADRAGETRERGRETYFDAQERLRERLSESRRPRPAAEDRRRVVGGEPGEGGAHEPREVSAGPDERSEELRRKVRETRARLRERLGEPGGEGRP